MPSVFLSYSQNDLSLIKELEAQLAQHPEISIWRDQEKISGGQKWPQVLGEAIANQDVILLAWSKSSAASHFVEFEWTTAIALKKTIVPCLLDRTSLPPSLTATHGILVGDLPRIVAALTAAVLPQDAGRRAEVFNKLDQIMATKPEEVLEATRRLFDQRGWIVRDVIQAKTVHIHNDPDPSRLPLGVAHERLLKGRVFLIEDSDELAPASGVSVTLLHTAESAVTGPEGLFKLVLPDTCQPGIKVELAVGKEEWVLDSPIAGEITIPASDTELVELRLAKKGSPKLWSAERIEKFIQDMAGMAKEQIRPAGKPQDVDFSRYIKDWATSYGFSPQRAQAEIDKWVAEAEQQDDPHQLGLAAYAKKNFGRASKYFDESAERKLKQREEAEENVRQLTEEAVSDYRLAGDAQYNQYEFEQALTCYQHALQCVSKENDQQVWAGIFNDIGRTHDEIGVRTKGDRIHHHLAEAVAAYRDALTVYTKAQLPQQWAMTQNNLGAALQNQGTRTSGEAGTRLLADAVAAYRDALIVRTKEQLPQDWAMTQNNLGNVLQEQGTRTGGEAGTHLLAEAIAAYRDALTVYTKAQFTQQWATTHNNLVNVLQEQGIRTGGEAGTHLLAEAVAAYRDALTVYRKAQFPQQWATTQNNLGAALQNQGTRTSGEAGIRLLADAVAAYRDAFTVYRKAQFPQQWAMTQNNLGNVLRDQGTRTGGEAGIRLLADAVAAYRDAFTVYRKAQFPQQWAMTQNNLGNVLRDQGIRTGGEAGTRFLADAVAAYRDALTVYTKAQLPQQWAMTQNNLGAALQNQGTRTSGEAGTRLLADAVAAYRDALTVRTKEPLPLDWAMTQNNLGNVLRDQDTRTGGKAGETLIRQAVNAFELALQVRTREALPVQWEQIMANLEIAKKALEDMK